MSSLPVVSIVGRPNVGKSSLFNRILRRKVAVVDDTPGVTRDRNYHVTTWNRCTFSLVDTGGLIPSSKESIPSEIHKQVEISIKEASVVVFCVDASTSPTDIDLQIARRLRKEQPLKIILAANKTESPAISQEAARYIQLGCGEPILVSALHGKGVGNLLDEICDRLRIIDIVAAPDKYESALSIAILGRPNAGKSSFVNKLLKMDRMIVDDIPGTTRDAIDSIMIYNDKPIRLIDTAGLRKKAQVHNDVEYYSNLRALESIKRCDICVLLVDTPKELGEQDMKILAQVKKYNKATILCWNKWDLVEKDHKTFDKLVAETKRTYKDLQFTPMVSVSALTGQRVTNVIDIALQIHQNMSTWIQPSLLREQFLSLVQTHPHPYISSKNVRFMAIKQQRSDHPFFVIYCTNYKSVTTAYKRFLINKLQETYSFSGCPITVIFKQGGGSGKSDGENSSQSAEKE